ncbi:MAG: AtpZ/AtpI family protein [bacterium]|nr:AtpZ/AtpI family protein [Candidatus Sumerlaeota bacterium]
MTPPQDDNGWRNAGMALMLPLMMASAALIGCAIGYYLDRWLGTRPWLFLLFLVLGFVTGARETIKTVRGLNKKKK